MVLLDLLMPGVDGYGVLQAMRADDSTRDIPVIIISARGVEGDVVTAEALYVNRPGGLSVGELMGCLGTSLDLLVPS